MRVGIVADFYLPWVGGPATAIHNLARGLSERGHTVSLLVPSPVGPGSVERDGDIEVTRVPTVPLPFGYRLRAAIPPRGVGAWICASLPDVIHVHHPFPLSAATVYAGRRSGIPLVATNHTIPSCSLWGIRDTPVLYPAAHRALAWWIVSLLERCDTVCTPTETAAQLLRDLGYRDELHVISNGIDTEQFSPGPEPAELRRRLGLDDRPIVLYTGRLDAEKDMDTWLRAAAEIARVRDVQFVIGGQGSDRRRLQALAARLGIADRAHFIGYVPAIDLPGLYRLANVYLMTSPVELQSISTLEAAACGVPVVAVRAGALPELVEEGGNGYLVVDGDWKAAAQAVIRILEDDRARPVFSARSREIALRHALPRTVLAYERLLEDVAARATRDRPVGRLTATGW